MTRPSVTPAEAQVLVVAATLAVAVFAEGARGTLTRWMAKSLLASALLAGFAALLHMAAR